MDTDWDAIERDYLHGAMRYQDIAEKYGLPCSMVKKRGREGGWAEKRRQMQRAPKASRKERVRNVADQLLDMIELAVQETERQFHANLNTQRTETGTTPKGKGSSVLDMGEIKQITAALKEILLLQNGDEEEANTGLTVILEGDLEKYAK